MRLVILAVVISYFSARPSLNVFDATRTKQQLTENSQKILNMAGWIDDDDLRELFDEFN
ncbi:MAG: hypothetical protein ACLU4J_17660 [Butyricimonas paravirosa]